MDLESAGDYNYIHASQIHVRFTQHRTEDLPIEQVQPSLLCCYKMNTTTTMQHKCS